MKLGADTPAVVTGGASGLGRATAEALAAQGVKVAIFDIQEEKGEEVAKQIGGIFCNVNILDEASCEAGFAKAREAQLVAEEAARVLRDGRIRAASEINVSELRDKVRVRCGASAVPSSCAAGR